MKKTVSTKVENIFAHAVALEQSGRLKNTIHASPEDVFILNSDNTVLIHFPLSAGDSSITGHVSFRASDYDSNSFTTEGDAIVFHQKSGDITRKKICKTAEASFDEVADLWDGYMEAISKTKIAADINLPSTIVPMLEEGLSHIEFFSEDGQLVIRQRDIYSGVIIELTKESKGLGLSQKDMVTKEFGPIGMRTSDFMALFSFQDSVHMVFHKDMGFCYFSAQNYKMKGIVALCLYDEMGETTVAINSTNKEKGHGGKEQEVRRSEQKVDRTAGVEPKARSRK